MRFSKLFLPILLLGLVMPVLGVSQPKILDVNDNLGHSCEFDSIPEDGERRNFEWGSCSITDESISMDVTEELVVTDEMEINICINKIEKAEGGDIQHQFRFSYENHPSDVREWTDSRCNKWDVNTSHFTKNWLFRWHMKNQDDIAYQNPSVGSDFRVDVAYGNLALEEEAEDIEVVEYDSVTISREEYENLKSDSEKLKSQQDQLDNLQEEVDDQDSTIGQLNDEIEYKDTKIEDLNDKVSDKESTIEEMNSTISTLENRVEELERGIISSIMSIF